VDYTRLPGKKRGFFRKSTLWLGSDHILAIESNYFTEIYKHFHFKDIQAIIFCQTSRCAIYSIIFIIAIFLSGLMLLSGIVKHSKPMIILMGIAFAGFLVSLILNAVRGPTCSARLKMPLTDHELPSLCRFKYARETLTVLRPLVQKYQGELHLPEDKSTIGLKRRSTQSAAGIWSGRKMSWFSERELVQDSGLVHVFLFGLLMVGAVVTLRRFYSNDPLLFYGYAFLNCALMIVLVMALVRQHGRTLVPTAKGLTWSVLILFGARNVFDFYYGIISYALHNPKKPLHNQWEIMQAFSKISPATDLVLRKSYMCFILPAFILGAWGIGAIVIMRLSMKRGSTVNVPGLSRAAHEGEEK
jgi:hypothetical protein